MRGFAAVAALGATLLAQQMTPLVGTVVDPAGKPVAGATVVAASNDGRGYMCLDLATSHAWRDLARARTDDEGRFGLQLPAGIAVRVEVDRPPYAIWQRLDITAGEDLPIRLQPACTCAGQLVLRASGKGTPGLVRILTGRTSEPVELARMRTDADGRFAFERLPAGPIQWVIEPDAALAPEWTDAELAVDRPLRLDLALEEGIAFHGVVVDATSGKPIAGARIGDSWTMGRSVVTGPDGGYELRGCSGDSNTRLYCRRDGYCDATADVQPPAAAGAVDFALDGGIRVVGTLRNAAGSPVADAYVAAVALSATNVSWRSVRSQPDGTFELVGVPANGGMLFVRCVGCASLVHALPPVPTSGVVDVGALALPAPKAVSGMVYDLDGKPVAGAVVSLRGTNADRSRFAADPTSWSLLRYYLGERIVRTDDRGHYAFGDVAPGDYELALGRQMTGSAAQATFAVVADAEPHPYELSLR